MKMFVIKSIRRARMGAKKVWGRAGTSRPGTFGQFIVTCSDNKNMKVLSGRRTIVKTILNAFGHSLTGLISFMKR